MTTPGYQSTCGWSTPLPQHLLERQEHAPALANVMKKGADGHSMDFSPELRIHQALEAPVQEG